MPQLSNTHTHTHTHTHTTVTHTPKKSHCRFVSLKRLLLYWNTDTTFSRYPNKQISDDAGVILSRLELHTKLHSPHAHHAVWCARARACAGTTTAGLQGYFSVIGRMHSRCSGARAREAALVDRQRIPRAFPALSTLCLSAWSGVRFRGLALRCFDKTSPLFVTGWSGNQVAWKTILSFVSCQTPVQRSWMV